MEFPDFGIQNMEQVTGLRIEQDSLTLILNMIADKKSILFQVTDKEVILTEFSRTGTRQFVNNIPGLATINDIPFMRFYPSVLKNLIKGISFIVARPGILFTNCLVPVLLNSVNITSLSVT